ncbi:sulfotransferase family protein [Pedobacter petrophilus]|uniref:Sulfotransferase family protein n=1 Tax=Pedobacter petrophilus TaxID=1908241 RepID=A0A7K0G0H9_9SPHI|nr:sulfotransferase family protein [Pedobacter petrophilus]MRX77348.1 sulfotransferase family protein [Pedobacter petrophilus]
MSEVQHPLQNWIPYQLKQINGEYTCKWLYTNGDHFTGPFFDESISKCLSHPFNSNAFKPLSNIAIIPEWASGLKSLKPTAFIFHISRCGSTLISQSLSINERHIVLPEAPFIDEVLRLTKHHDWLSATEREEMVKATIKIYGHNPDGNKKHLFIKTDSWHIHFMPLIRRLYPDVPFILLYRKPDEVIRSHQKFRGMQAVPGVVPNELLGIEAGAVDPADFDGHTAKVLENYLEAFVNAVKADPLTLLVNYNEGIMAIMQRFCNFANVALNNDDWAQINTRSHFHAKHPGQVFSEVQPKETVPAYQHEAFKQYEQLEVLRLAQPAQE